MIDKNFIKQALEKMVNGNRLIVNSNNNKFRWINVGSSLYSKSIHDFQFMLDEKLIIGLPMGGNKRSSIVFQIPGKGRKYLEEVK